MPNIPRPGTFAFQAGDPVTGVSPARCNNFLYGSFKAARRGRSRRRLGADASAPACVSHSGGAWCRSAGTTTRGRTGPLKTGEVTGPRRI
jgi:hypothetical protein